MSFQEKLSISLTTRRTFNFKLPYTCSEHKESIPLSFLPLWRVDPLDQLLTKSWIWKRDCLKQSWSVHSAVWNTARVLRPESAKRETLTVTKRRLNMQIDHLKCMQLNSDLQIKLIMFKQIIVPNHITSDD